MSRHCLENPAIIQAKYYVQNVHYAMQLLPNIILIEISDPRSTNQSKFCNLSDSHKIYWRNSTISHNLSISQSLQQSVFQHRTYEKRISYGPSPSYPFRKICYTHLCTTPIFLYIHSQFFYIYIIFSLQIPIIF